MSTASNTITINDAPMVLLPLEQYERMREDLDMLRSKKLPGRVAKARADIKAGEFSTLDEVKKRLNVKA